MHFQILPEKADLEGLLPDEQAKSPKLGQLDRTGKSQRTLTD